MISSLILVGFVRIEKRPGKSGRCHGPQFRIGLRFPTEPCQLRYIFPRALVKEREVWFSPAFALIDGKFAGDIFSLCVPFLWEIEVSPDVGRFRPWVTVLPWLERHPRSTEEIPQMTSWIFQRPPDRVAFLYDSETRFDDLHTGGEVALPVFRLAIEYAELCARWRCEDSKDRFFAIVAVGSDIIIRERDVAHIITRFRPWPGPASGSATEIKDYLLHCG